MKVHKLKIRPPYYQDILDGRKNFEVRYNDREYKEGDILVLCEHENVYTGRVMRCVVDYVLSDFCGIESGYVVMSIRVCSAQEL